MASITKRTTKDGKTRYRVLIRKKGAPTQSATFGSKTKAKRWARNTEAAIDEGRHFPGAEARRRTVSDVIDRYKSTKLHELKARDRDRRLRLLKWWAKQLGDPVLANLTPAKIAEARDALLDGEGLSGEPVTKSTANRYLTALSAALKPAAGEWQWIAENPCSAVSRLREPRGRVRFLDDEERERLLAACRAEDEDRLYPLVMLAICTGARRGELLGLRWRDIDLERATATFEDTKNRERRTVPLTGPAIEVLEQLAKVRRIDDDRIFADRRGRVIFPRGPWERSVEAAKLDDFTFHDLRHTAASYLAMNGATLAEIAEVLGHKTLAMVKRYSHLTEAHTRGVVERMTSSVFGTGDGAG